MVTHQLQYLEYAQNIIIMNEGEMEGQGTIEMLKYSGIEYTELMDQPVDQTGEDDNEIPELTLKVNNESSLKLRNVSTKSVDQLQGLLQKSLHTMESGYGISGKERGFKVNNNYRDLKI